MPVQSYLRHKVSALLGEGERVLVSSVYVHSKIFKLLGPFAKLSRSKIVLKTGFEKASSAGIIPSDKYGSG